MEDYIYVIQKGKATMKNANMHGYVIKYKEYVQLE